jgi:hypothetical protein
MSVKTRHPTTWALVATGVLVVIAIIVAAYTQRVQDNPTAEIARPDAHAPRTGSAAEPSTTDASSRVTGKSSDSARVKKRSGRRHARFDRGQAAAGKTRLEDADHSVRLNGVSVSEQRSPSQPSPVEPDYPNGARPVQDPAAGPAEPTPAPEPGSVNGH